MVIAQILAPRKLDWTRNYDARSDTPFGTLALRHFLPEAFDGRRIVEVNQSIVETVETVLDPSELDFDPVNYLFINNGFVNRGQGVDMSLDQFESEALLAFVATGNNVFLATEAMSGTMVDSLGLAWSNMHAVGPFAPVPDTSIVYIQNAGLPDSVRTAVSSSIASGYFSSFDTTRSQVLGLLKTPGSDWHPNFILVRWGSGHFFVHANPGLFSNYGLAEAGTAGYAFSALSHMPDAPLLHDNYYKAVRGRGARTPLRFVLQQPALRLAYIVSLVSLALFIMVGARRRRRPIPTIEAPANATMDYVATIGRLHMSERDYRWAAFEKMRHWFEFIRDELNLDVRSHDDLAAEGVMDRVVARSGVAAETVGRIRTLATNLNAQESVTSSDLIALASEIDTFYSRCSRFHA